MLYRWIDTPFLAMKNRERFSVLVRYNFKMNFGINFSRRIVKQNDRIVTNQFITVMTDDGHSSFILEIPGFSSKILIRRVLFISLLRSSSQMSRYFFLRFIFFIRSSFTNALFCYNSSKIFCIFIGKSFSSFKPHEMLVWL